MKHASERALRGIGPLLAKLRQFPLRERKLGVFYRGSSAFVHFHEDPLGIFAHMKTTCGWKRTAVNTAAEVRSFLSEVRAEIGERR